MKNQRADGGAADIWDRRGVVAIVAGVAVCAAWMGLGILASTREKPADFGEMFGAASALFSGLAFAGLVYTILLQRSELSLQRRELTETRREMRAQTSHFEVQNRMMREQAVGNTFFELLRLHNDIVNSIDLRSKRMGEEIARGRDCFKIFFNDFSRELGLLRNSFGSKIEVIQAAYEKFFKTHQADVGHYFRSLYNMVKLVDRAELPDKLLYMNLVRAQLSSYEQALLFYNCLTHYGNEKFKPLIEKYGFFKNFSLDLLINEQDKMFYAATAFSSATNSPRAT